MNTRIGAIVYLEEETKPLFLALKRSFKDGGFWQYVTGTPEHGETDLQAIKRELNEETGIGEKDIVSVRGPVYSFEWQKGSTMISERVYAVLCNSRRIQLSHEHVDYKWLNDEDALNLLEKENNKKALAAFIESF